MTFQLKIVLFCVFATVGLGGTFSTPEFLWLASAHTEMYAVCFIVLSMFVTVFVLIFRPWRGGIIHRFGMVSDIYKQVFAVSLLAFCILPFLAKCFWVAFALMSLPRTAWMMPISLSLIAGIMPVIAMCMITVSASI